MNLRLLFSLLFFSFYALAYSNKIANYTINVSLHPESKTLKGYQKLTWTNTSNVAVKELHFHMYLNAFKDSNSTFMKGSGGMLRSDKADTSEKINFGNIKISKIILNGKENLFSSMKFIQPDDLNTKDQTVLLVKLPYAINPNETAVLDIDFVSKLPKIFARTGWAANDYFFAGQWFPKIGVLEKNGNWNCHQFHADTEFYSDFGSYKVQITAPKTFIVAATGQKTAQTKLKNNQIVHTYEIENVHDFAWTASPHYLEFAEIYKGIELKAYMQPEHKSKAPRYFESVKNAIDFMEKHVGKYPHKTLTMIDPSFEGGGSGGMEYPTLITCGANWGVGKYMKFQEVVTIHEFVHQYFQGILASNEFENSWMDEGFTQYYEGRIMDEYYPKGSIFNFFSFSVNDAAVSRENYVSMHNPSITPIRNEAWKYPKGTYAIMSYTKPATVLKTLENLIGQKNFDEIMKTYFQKFQFSHPQPHDFTDLASEIIQKQNSMKNPEKFFEQTIYQAKVCDFSVQNLENYSFELRNLKNMFLEIDVKIVYQNGKAETFKWNGENKNISRKDKIEAVFVDPENKNWLDINLTNNSISVNSYKTLALKYSAKFMFWLQNAFLLV